MPFIVGESEHRLAILGVRMATVASSRYRCPACTLGELRLTRELHNNGEDIGPAFFACNNTPKCGCVAVVHGDDVTGAVFPAGFTAPDSGAPGKTNRTKKKPDPSSGFNRNWGGGWE